jgi:hypothetical protein
MGRADVFVDLRFVDIDLHDLRVLQNFRASPVTRSLTGCEGDEKLAFEIPVLEAFVRACDKPVKFGCVEGNRRRPSASVPTGARSFSASARTSLDAPDFSTRRRRAERPASRSPPIGQLLDLFQASGAVVQVFTWRSFACFGSAA